MLFQRVFRGFDDYEVYRFEQNLAKWLSSRLKVTIKKKRKMGHAIPSDWDKTTEILEKFSEDKNDKFYYNPQFRKEVMDALNFVVDNFGKLSY